MPSTTAPPIWRTPFTQVFGCQVPIMGAPMAGVSGGLLAAETCRAGALGFIAAGHATDLEALHHQVQLFRQHAPPDAKLGLGFITHSSCRHGDFTTLETILARHEPRVVQFFAPAIVRSATAAAEMRTNVDVARAHGAQVLVQVGSVADAKEAVEAGVDGIIAQGSEAGGHGLRRNLGSGTFSLAARIATTLSSSSSSRRIPVLAAGGMVSGHSLAAALALGCDGIVLGTRLWASHEATGRANHKDLLTRAEPDDCIRTTVMDQIWNRDTASPWPYPYDSVGVLKNDLTEEWDRKSAELLAASMDQVALKHREAIERGDTNYGSVYAGEGVGDIASVEGAFDIIQSVSLDAAVILRAMPRFLVDDEAS